MWQSPRVKTRTHLPIVGLITPQSAHAAAIAASKAVIASEGAASPGAHALGWLGDAVTAVEARMPRPRPVGCVEGCAYCCHLKVIASPPEVIHLARHLRATRSADELAALLDKIREVDRSTRNTTTSERAAKRIACPLLVSGRCSAYEARPLHCAGANAYDPEDCHRAFDTPEHDLPVAFYTPQAQLADVIGAGISSASFENGQVGAMLELVAALVAILEDPSVEDRWLRGEDAFAAARDRELEALVAAQMNAAPNRRP